MYNKIYCALCLVISFNFCNAQAHLGKEWFIGYNAQILNFDVTTPTSRIVVDFTLDTIHIIKGNSNICDSNGKLILATDGFKLLDSVGKFIQGGGENINNDSIVYEYSANPVSNSSIILPKGNNQYYVFVATMSDTRCYNFFHTTHMDTFAFDEVRYSIVDMNANNGKGKIIEKNKLLLHVDEYPYLNMTNFTSCRHANGRDWWLLKPSARMRQIMYKFLVTPDTVITYKENLPMLFNNWAYDNRGQSCFSKDGSLYAECNQFGPHTIYNFDRCSGELQFLRMIDITSFQDTFGFSMGNGPTWSGLCFSPNCRFLYTCDFFNVYQIDLLEPNDSLAIKRVSKDTNSTPPPHNLHANYHAMQLTPTGVIYLGNRHGATPNINGILYPDKLGDSCGFKFSYFISHLSDTLEISNTMDPPNMPFYGLGKLEGSPCDTLYPPPPAFTSIKLYPNPVSDNLSIELPSISKKYELVIFNIIGEAMFRIKEENIVQYKITLALGHLATGLYSIKIITNNEQYIGKFVKE